jgi:hypothetical protein
MSAVFADYDSEDKSYVVANLVDVGITECQADAIFDAMVQDKFTNDGKVDSGKLDSAKAQAALSKCNAVQEQKESQKSVWLYVGIAAMLILLIFIIALIFRKR